MYIEGIALEHIIPLTKSGINASTNNVHIMQCFTLFLSDDSKQDSATAISHS